MEQEGVPWDSLILEKKDCTEEKGENAQTFTIYRLRNQRGYSIIERVKSRTFCD